MILRLLALIALLACSLPARATGPFDFVMGLQQCRASRERLQQVRRLPRFVEDVPARDVWWVDAGMPTAVPVPKDGMVNLVVLGTSQKFSGLLVLQPEQGFHLTSHSMFAETIFESPGAGFPSYFDATLSWLEGRLDLGDCSDTTTMVQSAFADRMLTLIGLGDLVAVAAFRPGMLIARSDKERGTTWHVLRDETPGSPAGWVSWTIKERAEAYRPVLLRARPADPDAPEWARSFAIAFGRSDVAQVIEIAAARGWKCRWQGKSADCADMKRTISVHPAGTPRRN